MTELPLLSIDEFPAYFEALHGYAPFPWQVRLLTAVATERRWPKLLDLPTGSGKTAALDIALFHLALDSQRSDRAAPLRAILIVDRRTIVDQGYERARHIQRSLASAAEGTILARVRTRLVAISRGDARRDRTLEPFRVALLRGGIARDEGWARAPDEPLIAVSTVDQVGSRLLFRGYGLSAGMRPIHAGLLANDALLLLDEVHLSEPFAETLAAIEERYRKCETSLPDRWQVVKMSATSRDAAQVPRFALDAKDRTHPVLRRRLEAKKLVALEEVRVSGGESAKEQAFASAIAHRAQSFAAPGAVIGVVVNRVARARAVMRQIAGSGAEVELITGRMRPIERADLEHRLGPRIRAGRKRTQDGPPLIVVATQCIEAGADYDFDALVSECASLDALRQRFGRLNRLGELPEAKGCVLIRSDAANDEDDPVYGAALAKTWAFLNGREQPIDLGLSGLEIPQGDALGDLLPRRIEAPVLLPSHLDAWAQTSPQPDPDPDVALWLHGPDRGQPEVQIVWRADIEAAEIEAAERSGAALEALVERLEACPPSSAEALSVSIAAANRWLAAEPTEDVADVEGAKTPEEEPAVSSRLAISWLGADSQAVSARELKPGMTIVVPASYGGLSDGSWAPESVETVSDLGDRAARAQRARAIVRIDERVLGALAPALPPVPVPVPEDDPDRDDAAQIRPWLEAAAATNDAIPEWLRLSAGELLAEMKSRRPCRILRFGTHFALLGRKTTASQEASGITTEDEEGSFTGIEVPLSAHLAGVEQYARDFALRSGLPDVLVSDVSLAGALHDLGKADPRFQLLLHGGSSFKAATAKELLAKSATTPGDHAARRRAAARSGYPRGTRHEVMSLALIEEHRALIEGAHDPDLVCHLVASHHGRCRPLAPLVEDGEPVSVSITWRSITATASSAHGLERLDSGVSARFWRLVAKYGWFGLAWLEAILRLADHRRSEAEQRGAEVEA